MLNTFICTPQYLAVTEKSYTFALAKTANHTSVCTPPHDSKSSGRLGEMVEWSITAVLKTAVLRGTGGSNPSLSAKISVTSCKTTSCADFSFKGAPNLRQNFLGN